MGRQESLPMAPLESGFTCGSDPEEFRLMGFAVKADYDVFRATPNFKQFKELGFKKKRSYDIYEGGRQAEEKYQHHPPASQKLPGKGRAFSWLRFRDRAKSRFVCESDPHEKYRKLPYDGDVVAALTANDQSAIRHLLKASNSFTHGGCIYGGDLKAAVYANDREAIRRIAKEGRSAALAPPWSKRSGRALGSAF